MSWSASTVIRWLKPLLSVAWVLVALAISGCATIRVSQHEPGVHPPGGTFVAGVGKVDLTPPPGLPLFGYSKIRAQSAAGFHTRLYARAVYLEDASGERVALVQCDLGAISALLHHQVAQTITQETGITVDRLLLGATHTHAGPGGYFGEVFYNHWGSNAPGFDPDILAFLVERIAQAVQEAYRTRAPAQLAIGQTSIYGLTHNRSLEAYNNDQSHLAPDQAPSTLPPDYQAIDPTFTMLRIDRVVGAGTQPLGAFTNFAMHGTVLAPDNDLYSGDVHAVAERALEWAIQRRYGVQGEVVHALTNGAEGDVSPAFTRQGVAEAERLGLALATRAFDLFVTLDTRLTTAVQLRRHYEEVSLRDGHSVDQQEVCQRAMVGSPVLGGSEEGQSALLRELFPETHEGARRSLPEGCHTWKLKALDFLQDLIPETDFPTLLPLQTIRINELLLVTVPGEMTTEMGQRVKRAVLQAAQHTNQGIAQVAIVGLANQYMSYFATPEEYELQHYEGASTLYGPASGPFIAARLERLVAQMADTSVRPAVPLHSTFHPGPEIRYFPEAQLMQGEREAGRVKVDHSTTPPTVHFVWQDTTPGAIQFDLLLVRLETQDRNGHWVSLLVDHVPVDDRGLRLEVRYLRDAELPGTGEWQATWYPQTPLPGGLLRFAIAAREELPALHSAPFSLVP
jgi:neutral ceramidase